MSLTVVLIVNITLMTLIVAAIVGLLSGGIVAGRRSRNALALRPVHSTTRPTLAAVPASHTTAPKLVNAAG